MLILYANGMRISEQDYQGCGQRLEGKTCSNNSFHTETHNEIYRWSTVKDLRNELGFSWPREKEYALVAMNPIAQMLAIGIVIQLISDLTNRDYAGSLDKSVELSPKGRKSGWEVVTANNEAAAIQNVDHSANALLSIWRSSPSTLFALMFR